ncbi:hypothetical protein [Faecalicatena contorta]|uniref:DUF5405 domain-containing protein n=1 Tax=Faecalicatena contorta TaxID=39482 RepID=A0A316AHG5_9FIRM|nr:hypothetical protein [Faecalicatena contorta]PWJ49327.1 hypothetical protein A8805_10723 [Faecalicatena contorta]SUQ14571.1 hypothetical protein SAMN05216529_10723 [Faecalicatena contorta]
MTTIELKNGYYIEIDPMNYTLKQRYTGTAKNGDKKESERVCGYFGKIRTVIEKYIFIVQLDVTDGERLSMQEYVKTIEQVNKIAVQGLVEGLRQYEIQRGRKNGSN